MAVGGVVARLRLVSVLETASFVALLSMMMIESEGGVSVVGLLHGLLFLWYAVLVVSDRTQLRWSWAFAVLVIVTGPLGALIVLERLRREQTAVGDETS
jgi:integral membrane protein